MSRRSARKNAFFLLFQMDFSEAAEFEQVKEVFFAEKEEPVEEETELTIGAVSENVYENESFGYGCALDDTWFFYDAEQMAAMNQETASTFNDESMKQMLELLRGTSAEQTAGVERESSAAGFIKR